MAIRHTHVTRESRDCDGNYSHEYIATGDDAFAIEMHYALPLTDEGSTDGKPEIENELHSVEIDGKWTPLYEGSVSYSTEEGYVATYMRECADDCDTSRSLSRDHSAEAAGY